MFCFLSSVSEKHMASKNKEFDVNPEQQQLIQNVTGVKARLYTV